ncbi:flagellar hook-associated protein FlgK [Aestuariivita sp.]|jgi:flagellar hook-associated protein 1 FlgK|uniref:flagellar hook-associated protein FlgK n=1 Tax=Aestuariivita sp. TaxID=1872407 RepID=UPI002172EB21|nr:flagellar hook-associated protein FlgK [Aestuariivita sp.]MCE8008991.1 flagellar hook-associated protein FlgK [Aestuariivita sp.]
MSLTSALNAASTGLRTTQTLSRVTAENVANSTTEGYARRRAITVTGNAAQGGPVIGEIRREVDAALTRMSRQEVGSVARHQAIYEALNNYTTYLGQPGDGVSPAEKFSVFNTSLTTLVNTPSSSEAQIGAILAAEDLTRSLQGASQTLADIRSDVDMEIRYEVSELNQALYDLSALNQRLGQVGRGTVEAAQFGDQMDQLIDKVAGIVDIRVYANADGAINIYTTGGAALLERTLVQDVSFNAADGSLLAGQQAITPNEPGIRGIEQGSLAGLLQLKRDTLPQFQLQLDEYARGLIQAFESADASLAPGQPGLFTDGGNAFDPANLDNLAARITVNDVVRQSAGGEVWRIRDGLGAPAQGEAGDSRQVQAFIDALQAPLNADAATGVNRDISIADFGAQIVTAQSTSRARAEADLLAAQSAADVVEASRLGYEGVNIDEEMQDLQMIQQSYAANSRVLTTVLGMIDILITDL